MLDNNEGTRLQIIVVGFAKSPVEKKIIVECFTYVFLNMMIMLLKIMLQDIENSNSVILKTRAEIKHKL